MKIVAVNGSPRKKKSNTDYLLLPFLEGAREQGAEVEVVYIQGMKIKPCLGCFKCWLETPGECCQKDDAKKVLDKMREADVFVCATPLYIYGMTAQMKTLLDRIVSLAEPFIVIRDDHCSHPHREGVKGLDMVLISNCGFHELDNFDALVAHIKAFCKVGGRKYLGALLRPEGEMLPFIDRLLPDKAGALFEAVREAGRQVARGEAISDEVASRVSENFLPRDAFVEAANSFFKAEMAKKAKAS